tara:strand:+ start:396 stop:668 length:273 start_codon:yes stop_codon:yes gene_type:complete
MADQHFNWNVIERYYAGMVPKLEFAQSYWTDGKHRWPTGLPPIGARVVDGDETHVVDSITMRLDIDGDGGDDAEVVIRFRKVRGNKRDGR